MYKVLIVDDEPTIREGLKTIIPWEEYGFQIVGTAKNGRRALELYDMNEVDLMVVDIRMPEMGGLELIQTIREGNQRLHFIILSGYADFEYAKQAIKWNVEGYMLKPVDEDELIIYLKTLYGKLRSEQALSKLKQQEEDQSKEKMIETIIRNEKVEKTLDFGWNSYQIMLFQIEGHHSNKYDNNNKLKLKLSNYFKDIGIVFTTELYLGLVLKEQYITKHKRDQLFHEVTAIFQENNTDFFSSIGQAVNKIEDIAISYREADQLLKRSFFYDRGVLMAIDSLPEPSNSAYIHAKQTKLMDVIEKVYYALEIGNRQAVEKIISETGSMMCNEGLTEHEIKKSYVQIVSSVLGKFHLAYPDVQRNKTMDISSSILEIHNKGTIKELNQFVKKLFSPIIEDLDYNNTDIQLKKIIDVINRNYHENLKLETLADAFNYNSAYLGKLFKKHTGEYFNTYLDKVRIEHSKKLLLEGLKVYKVAERVGYTNVDYFHSKFKKYVGKSPSTYKKGEK